MVLKPCGILPQMDASAGRVAIIGSGKMGEILAAGLVRSEVRKPDQVVVADADPQRAQQVAERYGLSLAASNVEAVEAAGVVLLAVKPKDIPAVLSEIASSLGESRLVLSIAAGIRTDSLEAGLSSQAPVVRAMPNVGSQVNEGITAICAGRRAGEVHLDQAREILEAVGQVIVIEEPYMDAVSAVSGSGPAYFALLAEALVDASVLLGLPRDLSERLVGQTMRGTAALVTQAGMEPVKVRESVTSPGGTTARAVRELERGGVRAAVQNAVQAAADRAAELGSK